MLALYCTRYITHITGFCSAFAEQKPNCTQQKNTAFQSFFFVKSLFGCKDNILPFARINPAVSLHSLLSSFSLKKFVQWLLLHIWKWFGAIQLLWQGAHTWLDSPPFCLFPPLGVSLFSLQLPVKSCVHETQFTPPCSLYCYSGIQAPESIILFFPSKRFFLGNLEDYKISVAEWVF